MKKLLVLLVTTGLMVTLPAVALGEVKTAINGEGNFGIDYAVKDYDNNDGANFSDIKLSVTANVDDNVTLFSKIKNERVDGKHGEFFFDEAWASTKVENVSLKFGYYGFGFGGSKDLLDVAMSDDLKSKVGIRADVPLAEGLTVAGYYATASKKEEGGIVSGTEAGAFGARLDYSQATFGGGVIYGQTDWKTKTNSKTNMTDYDSAKTYTLFAFYKPVTDLKAYVDYSTLTADLNNGKDEKNDTIIMGALYTPTNLPIEIRAEYDLDDKNDVAGWSEFNPWAFRLDYKFNANVKVEFNRKLKSPTSKASELKLNVCF